MHHQCDATQNCLTLNNFWRSLSNLTINVASGSGCQKNTEFWAVSQAAPMRRVAGANPHTTLDTTAVSADALYLYTEDSGSYRVMVQRVQHHPAGTSWASGSTAGTSRPIKNFFVANPKTSVAAINLDLLRGKDLILTSGVYRIDAPIVGSRPATIILGLGFAILSPQRGNAAMVVLDVPGTKRSGVIFDAGPKKSRVPL